MKRWLDRWRISRALDDGTPLPAGTQRRLEADPELRAWHGRLQALESELGREARAWREAARAEGTGLAAEPLLARLPGTARATRSRLRPVMLLVSSAAALVLALLAVQALRPEARPSAELETAAAHASGHATARASAGAGVRSATRPSATTAWSRLDRLARRTRTLSPSALGQSGEQALLQEARNVARDARQLATHLAERVPFAGAEPR